MDAVEVLQTGLDSDRVELIYLRGFMLANGIGLNGYVEPDPQAARQYFLAAAERGLSIAQVAIGSMLMADLGGEPDMQEAVRWLTAAANQGHTSAMKMLAILDLESSDAGASIDIKTVIFWLQKAADGKDAQALQMLGDIYLKGQGVEKDENRAVECYEQAARLGYHGAHNTLAHMYGKGTSTVAENSSRHLFHWKEGERLWDIHIERLEEHIRMRSVMEASRRPPC
jgi:TPR repeat protein